MGAGPHPGQVRHLMIKVGIDPHSGFCGGVIRAITTAEDFLDRDAGCLYSLGAIVHNEAELKRLEARGLGRVGLDTLEGLHEGDTVLIRAHGEPPSTYECLKKLGLHTIDCTCPVVLRLQARVEEASKHAQVLIFGKRGHPEVLGLVGRTGCKALVVENAEGLQRLIECGLLDSECPVELFSQTTMSPEAYGEIIDRLSTFAGDRLTVHDSICAQVASRHRELRDFASRHDVLVFVAGKDSSNGKVLYEWCRSVNPRTHFITSPSELRPEWFDGAASAGVCGATSTPKWLLEQVASKIEYLQ